MEKESTDNSKNLEIGLHCVFGFVGHNLGGVGAPSRGCGAYGPIRLNLVPKPKTELI